MMYLEKAYPNLKEWKLEIPHSVKHSIFSDILKKSVFSFSLLKVFKAEFIFDFSRMLEENINDRYDSDSLYNDLNVTLILFEKRKIILLELKSFLY